MCRGLPFEYRVCNVPSAIADANALAIAIADALAIAIADALAIAIADADTIAIADVRPLWTRCGLDGRAQHRLPWQASSVGRAGSASRRSLRR